MHKQKITPMKTMISITTMIALFAFTTVVNATTVPLNTGYNYWSSAVYTPIPPLFPSPSITKDNYWINIASYPTTAPAIGSSFRIDPVWAWLPALGLSSWISARNTHASVLGPDGRAYTIFRKCFCLQPGWSQAQISFRARADNTMQLWLNSQLNTLLPPSWGNYNGPPLTGGTNNQSFFHTGPNCVYAIVEDFGGSMGFDLEGSVTANGLLPAIAQGIDISFSPCSCPTGPGGNQTSATVMAEERRVVEEFVKLAEARRTGKQKVEYQGTRPKQQ